MYRSEESGSAAKPGGVAKWRSTTTPPQQHLRKKVVYWQPTGSNPHDDRDDWVDRPRAMGPVARGRSTHRSSTSA